MKHTEHTEHSKNHPTPRRSFLRRYWFMLTVMLYFLAAALVHIPTGIPQTGDTVILPLLDARLNVYVILWLILPLILIVGLMLRGRLRFAPPSPFRRIVTGSLLLMAIALMLLPSPDILSNYEHYETLEEGSTQYHVMGWAQIFSSNGYMVLACDENNILCQVEQSEILNQGGCMGCLCDFMLTASSLGLSIADSDTGLFDVTQSSYGGEAAWLYTQPHPYNG